jgi:type VI secretion system protein ImpH
MHPNKSVLGRGGPPGAEPVKFAASLSLSFPSHHLDRIQRPQNEEDVPLMIVNFMGLTGPSGILPKHYSELLLRLERLDPQGDSQALRAWLDIFNHRLISLFRWSWEKYRVFFPFERGSEQGFEPGTFGGAIFCLLGLGTEGLRNRIYVPGIPADEPAVGIDDVALIPFAGLLSHQPKCASILQTISQRLFGIPVTVKQFQGDYLYLDPPNQTRLGLRQGNNLLGKNAVVGERVWSIENKIRLRLGPLSFVTFSDYLPDFNAKGRKAFFAFCQFVRFYIGPHLDFDVQLVLDREEVPRCQLATGDEAGSRLGWNAWLSGPDYDHDPDDAVFESVD